MPVCPVHGVEMRAGRGGGYFCTRKVGIGMPGANDKGYCTQKVDGAPRASGSAPAVSSEAQMRIAALTGASRVCAGLNAEAWLAAADQALAWLKR